MEQRKQQQRGPRAGWLALLGIGAAAAFTLLLGVGRADALTLVDQESTTTNTGVAVANTGGNGAAGNVSDNTTDTDQSAVAGPAGDDAVAVNTAATSNSSTGNAAIHTGNANATGNHSATTQSQAVHADGDGPNLVLVDQESDVDNTGVAVANTGINGALGNASDNTVDNDQFADAGAAGDDSVAANFAGGVNDSHGSALITTGDAWAAGNVSDTYVAQLISTDDAAWLTLVDQESDVDNVGVGVANTGFNFALGNVGDNVVDNDQFAFAGPGGDDVVAVNTAVFGNSSTGAAFIRTGNATAVGNLSATTVCQGINAAPACPRALLPPLPGHHPLPGTPPTHTHTSGGTTTPANISERSRAIGSVGSETFGVGGGVLARTGSPVGVLTAVGVALVALGAVARRRALHS